MKVPRIPVRPETAAALLLLALFEWLTLGKLFSVSAGPAWNGAVYGSSVEQYIAGGYDLTRIDPARFPPFAANQMMATFIEHCVLWIASAGWMHRLTGWSLNTVYGVLLGLGFWGTGAALFGLCRRALGLSWIPSVLAGAWFIFCQGGNAIYYCKAHPEPLVTLFTALAGWGFFARRHAWGGAATLLGLFAKGSILPVAASFALAAAVDDASAKRGGFKGRVLAAAPYLLAVVVHGVVISLLFPKPQPSYFWMMNTFRVIWSMNWDRAFGYYLVNLDVLFLLAWMQLTREESAERFVHWLLFCVGALLLTMITDWWRNPYTTIIVQGILKSVEWLAKAPAGTMEIINLGSSRPVTLDDMIRTVAQALKLKPAIDRKPMQPGDVEQTYASVEKAQRLLGYKPVVSFDEGVRSFVEWYLRSGEHKTQERRAA